MPLSSMVEMETAPLKRSGERQIVWSTSTAVQNLRVGGHGCPGCVQIHWKCGRFVGICPRKHGMVASCSKPWKLETVFEMWKEPSIDGLGCLGDPCASGMIETNAGVTCSSRERKVRWFGAGYGWLDSYGSGYGRRRGCDEVPEDVWFYVTCRLVLWRDGVKC